jgi:hypothetical protein
VRHLWTECGHGVIRYLTRAYQNATTAGQLSDKGDGDMETKGYLNQLATLRSIIGRMECIDFNVGESYSYGNLHTIARPLSKLLRIGENLRDARLS